MEVSSLISITNGQAQKSSDLPRVMQAAQQFEAMLLESFLQPMEATFSSMPGGREDGMSLSGYRDMATQAVATAMAKAGGLGLADMVVRNLLHLRKQPGKNTAIGTGGPNGIKGFSPYADSN